MAKRILIADDSVTIQKAFAMTFAGADDVTVSGARSADEGLALAQRTHPDLIIADGVMPGRSGLRPVRVDQGRPGAAGGAGAHPGVQPAALRRRPRSESWRGRPAGQAVGHERDDGQGARPAAGAAPGPAMGVRLRRRPPAHRSAASLPTAAIDDDEYGEISIDTGRDSIPTIPRGAHAAPAPAAPSPGGRISSPSMPAVPMPRPPHRRRRPPLTSSPGMRPSLIPGMRPGAMPPARPGTVPARRPAAARCPRPRRRVRRLSRSGGR